MSTHPRDCFDLAGAQASEAAWLGAAERGRLHHAWLLAGTAGVGKATFAYRAARRLLGARPAPEHGLLGASPDDPVSRLIASQSHPDLLVLEKGGPDGKARGISVEEARRLPEFFAKGPGMAEWRVAIIDAADDLNLNSANAVLKTLEEPPERGVVLLVTHSPGRLLPTIRSRCRRLNFAPWPVDVAARFVRERTGLGETEAARLAELSGGAPGRALGLAAQGRLDLDAAAGALVGALPALDEAVVLKLTDRFRGAEGAARFALFFELLTGHVHAAALSSAASDPRRAQRIAAAWDGLARIPGQVEGLNLDRADALWTTAADLRRAWAA
jgi:DNA polymerase-3 subunit delta'